MADKLSLRVFVSSPGDVAEERALAGRVFRRLGSEFSDVVKLDVILWEHEPLFAHTGFQEQIPRPSQCDLVVSILWARLGTRLPADFAVEPGVAPPTGTEFEVRDALQAYAKFGRPNLMIYRKRAPPHVDMGSPDAEERFRQYKRLDEFCRTAFYDSQGAVLVAHHAFKDGADFEHRLTEHARKWIGRELEKAGEHRARPSWTRGSPFRGLQSFDAEYQDVFFGRSQAVGELIHRLHDTESDERPGTPCARLLLITGMSGNGKTSLVRAGLLPLLADRPVEGIAAWYTVAIRPSDIAGEAPAEGALGALAGAINGALPSVARFGMTVAQLAHVLHTVPTGAAARIETCLAAEATARKLPPEQVRLLICIDQLEEIFTVPSANTQTAQILALIVELAKLPSMWVVATLRSDFAHRLEAHPEIMSLLQRSAPYTLLAPRSDELLDMIREPALAAGLEFEERNGISLDRELQRDAGSNPESLPLLEYALQQLYEGRQGSTLLWDVYKPADREGGLRGSLVAEAERLLAADGTDGKLAFRRVMRELTSVAEDGTATRRYAPLDSFAAGSPEHAFLERLVRARLAVTDRHGTESVVCLAHEALLQSWPRAQAWLQEESRLLRLRDELQHDAWAWESNARSAGWLGSAADKLARMDQLEREALVPAGIASEYVAVSRGRARRNSLIRQAVVASICVLLVASIVAGFIASQQRDRAQAEALTADRTARFMVSLFELPDPANSAGFVPSVRAVLDRGARDVSQGLEREPQVRADLLTVMGETYTGLGLFEPAKKLLSQAAADQRGISVPPESRVRTLIAAGSELFLADDDDGAKTVLQSAVDLAQSQLPRDSVFTSEARDALADVLADVKQYPQAERLAREAITVDRTRGPDGKPILARSLNTLGNAYYYEGRLREAEAPMREALALRKQYFGLRNARTAESMNNVAAVLYQEGQYSDAANEWQEALPAYREIYGNEHPEVATLLNNLGRSALMAGRVDEAIPLLEQSLEIHEKTEEATHEDLVMPLNSLGMAYLYRGDGARAGVDIERALAIARLPKHDEILDQVLLNAADLRLAGHRTDGVAALLKEARQSLESKYPPGKDPTQEWRYAAWDAVNANLLALESHPDEARAVFAHAREVLAKRFGPRGLYVLRLDQRAAVLERAAKPAAPRN